MTGVPDQHKNLDNPVLRTYTGAGRLPRQRMIFGFLTGFYANEGKSHAQAFADTFAQVDEAEAPGIDSAWMVEQQLLHRGRPWKSLTEKSA